jgi:hypothetical protein
MSKEELPENVRITEAQLREVIERAARMPAHSEGISIAELREIGDQLDIDPRALAAALQEVLGSPAPLMPRPRVARRVARSLRASVRRALDRMSAAVARTIPASGAVAVAAGAASGLVAGLFSHALRETIVIGTQTVSIMHGSTAFIDVPATLALIALTILNSLRRRGSRDFGRYLRDTVATFAGFTALWSLSSGAGLTDDIVVFAVSSVVLLAIWGRLIIPSGSGDDGEKMSGDHPARMLGECRSAAEENPTWIDLAELRLRLAHA